MLLCLSVMVLNLLFFQGELPQQAHVHHWAGRISLSWGFTPVCPVLRALHLSLTLLAIPWTVFTTESCVGQASGRWGAFGEEQTHTVPVDVTFLFLLVLDADTLGARVYLRVEVNFYSRLVRTPEYIKWYWSLFAFLTLVPCRGLQQPVACHYYFFLDFNLTHCWKATLNTA